MTNDQPTPAARPPRSGGMSVSATLGIIVAAIAVLLGFLILRDLDRDRAASGPPVKDTDSPLGTTEPGVTTTAPVTTTSLITTGFKVMVANASGVAGSAKQMTTALQSRGYVVVEPTNAADSHGRIEKTLVYVVAGFEPGAESVAITLGGVEVRAMPNPPPIDTGDLGEATVLVMLGTDLAGKPLPTGAVGDTSPTGATTPAEATTTTG